MLYRVYECEESYGHKKKQLKTSKDDEYNSLLTNYFRLDVEIGDYYKEWSLKDAYFKAAAEQFYGVRILNQDVVENIFSFICSSNNNIKRYLLNTFMYYFITNLLLLFRISGMVNKLARFYGKKICEIDGNEFYSFPDVEALAQKGVDEKLKENGFGYRSKYINKSAQIIMKNGGREWLAKLKTMSYFEAKQNLITLTGVGAKVLKNKINKL